MTSRIGYFIGMALADIVNLFRGRQAVPCLVDWDAEPPVIIDQNAQRAEFARPARDPLDDCCPDYEVEDDPCIGPRGCEDERNYCCMTTDTIGEAQGKC